MANTLQRTARIVNVGTKQTARGDLFQVATADGTEYSTFNGGMANQARQLIGRDVLLRYTEKNVEKNGQWYTNRYYEGAEPTLDGGGVQQLTVQPGITFSNAPASTTSTAAFTTNPPENVREKRILRQTASKVAVQLLSYLPQEEQTPTGLLDVAEFLVVYYENGIRAGGFSDPGPEAPQAPLSDDDIPF